jgi:hypothetical protein
MIFARVVIVRRNDRAAHEQGRAITWNLLSGESNYLHQRRRHST